MQKFFVCAVRDRAVDCFGTPIFARSVREAVRSFSDELVREGSPMGQHSGDVDLFVFGTFLDATGEFQVGVPRLCAIGKDQLGGPVILDEFGGM